MCSRDRNLFKNHTNAPNTDAAGSLSIAVEHKARCGLLAIKAQRTVLPILIYVTLEEVELIAEMVYEE